MEYISGGELFDYIVEKGQVFLNRVFGRNMLNVAISFTRFTFAVDRV